MLLDQLPEGTGIGRTRSPLVHHRGRTIRERAVNDVAVACDPAHISRAPEHIVITDVEDPLKGEVSPEVVSSRGVNHPLGFAGGTGGVEHEQAIFTRHRFRGDLGALALHQLMPPLITASDHVDRLLGSLHHQHGRHGGAGAISKGCIHGRLQRHRLVFAKTAISGDHGFDVAVIQPIPKRLR